jgi:glutathione S-transferase
VRGESAHAPRRKANSLDRHSFESARRGHAQPEDVKLNLNRVVPTLVHDGTPIIESNVICEYIEGVWGDVSLRPAAAVERARMRIWLRWLDESVHVATGTVSLRIAFRPQHLKRQPEELRAWLTALDPARQERTRAAIELGMKAPQFASAVRRLAALADDMDAALEAWKLARRQYLLPCRQRLCALPDAL